MSEYKADTDLFSRNPVIKLELTTFLTKSLTSLGEFDQDMLDYITILLFRQSTMEHILQELSVFFNHQAKPFVSSLENKLKSFDNIAASLSANNDLKQDIIIPASINKICQNVTSIIDHHADILNKEASARLQQELGVEEMMKNQNPKNKANQHETVSLSASRPSLDNGMQPKESAKLKLSSGVKDDIKIDQKNQIEAKVNGKRAVHEGAAVTSADPNSKKKSVVSTRGITHSPPFAASVASINSIESVASIAKRQLELQIKQFGFNNIKEVQHSLRNKGPQPIATENSPGNSGRPSGSHLGQAAMKPCFYFTTPNGCRNGDKCQYFHKKQKKI